MEGYTNVLAILVPILLASFFMAIYILLIKWDEKTSYSFEDLRVQLNDVPGERLFCQITLYPWQHHKYREIKSYYQIGRVVFDLGRAYEINEIRGPYKCENAFFQNMLRFYLTEKNRIDTVIIEGNNVCIFNDSTIYFDTRPYLREIQDAYNMMVHSNLDKNTKERLAVVFEELYEMSNTNIIRCQKLMYYVDVLSEFTLINKTKVTLEILNVLSEIIDYLKMVNVDYYEEGKNMLRESVTFNINGQVNITGDGGNICAVQNNNININEIDIIVREIMQNISKVSHEDAETIVDAVEMVQEEIKKNEPNKKVISNGIKLIATMISVVNGIPNLAENLKKFVEYISAMIK